MRLAPLAALLLLAAPLAAEPVPACNRVTFSINLGAADAFFTGSATADTLLSGPGTVPSGPGARGGIYGQVIRVDRLGGPGMARLPASVREVVVVPWDYDASCRPLPWPESARWVTPGTTGFYLATLRPPAHWVDGKPTFDLHNPRHLPYTATRPIVEMAGDTAIASLLSPDEVFDFFRAFPSAAQIDSLKTRALEPLDAWAQEHPDLAVRPPARMLHAFVHGLAGNVALNETDHPALGTWKFTLHVPGDSARTFFARSEPHPADRWFPSRVRKGVPPAPRLMPPEGYTLLAATARSLAELPETAGDRGRHAFYYALAYVDSAGASGTHWRGSIMSLLRQALPDDPRVQAAVAARFEQFRLRFDQGLPEAIPARYVTGPDGVLRVRETLSLGGGEELVLEGQMLSRTVLRMPQ